MTDVANITMQTKHVGNLQCEGFIQIDGLFTRKTVIVYTDLKDNDADRLQGCRFSGVLIGEGVNLCDCEHLYKKLLQRVMGDTQYPVAVLLNAPLYRCSQKAEASE